MKNIFIIFILLLSTLLQATIDERKIDVYFANGIDTKKGIAEDYAYLIEQAIEATYYSGNINLYNKQIGEVYTAYNQTNNIVFDLWESLAFKL